MRREPVALVMPVCWNRWAEADRAARRPRTRARGGRAAGRSSSSSRWGGHRRPLDVAIWSPRGLIRVRESCARLCEIAEESLGLGPRLGAGDEYAATWNGPVASLDDGPACKWVECFYCATRSPRNASTGSRTFARNVPGRARAQPSCRESYRRRTGGPAADLRLYRAA